MKAYLELSEIELMEQVASYQRDQLLIRLLSRLGCRVSEALALKLDDIDFEQHTITILHLKRSVKLSCPMCKSRLGNRHQYCPVCGHKVDETIRSQQERRRTRVLPVDESTLAMLKSYMGTLLSGGEESPLFHLSRHRAWQIVRDCAKRAGLPSLVNPETGRIMGISPHRLRDAFSVHAMKVDDSGDGLRLLQEHLGHVSFNTTARYRKIAGEEHRQWYDRLWHKRPC
ncbi:tyrosine-type recombinase/integrase [Chloroflexota bacterium]